MPRLLTFIALVAACAMPAGAAPPTGFRESAEKGYYEFDAGALRGKMRFDGKWQGICSLLHTPTGLELAKAPGFASYYRALAASKRYGAAARDWPMTAKILADGALEIVIAPAEEHPLEIRGVFRCQQADAIDVETTVTPQVDMPRFELFLSNYVAPDFEASVYVKPNRFSKKDPPALLRADWNALIDGDYLMFPRDLAAAGMIYDGRWELGPNPVQWAVGRYMAAPLVVRRNAANGLAVIVMAPPDDCFAVSVPYNKAPPDGVAGHCSIYLSHFGRDLCAGQSATAKCRIAVRKDASDQEVVDLYQAYCAGK